MGFALSVWIPAGNFDTYEYVGVSNVASKRYEVVIHMGSSKERGRERVRKEREEHDARSDGTRASRLPRHIVIPDVRIMNVYVKRLSERANGALGKSSDIVATEIHINFHRNNIFCVGIAGPLR